MIHVDMIPEKNIIIRNRDGTEYIKFNKNEIYCTWKLNPKIWDRIKISVLKRDNEECVKCGNKFLLEVHHIIPLSKNINCMYDEDNCITLCKKCHKEVHKNDRYRYK